jgi:hypothetical protein
MRKLEGFTLIVISKFFLFQGLFFGGLANLIKDPDWYDFFESASISGYMISDNPKILPPETLEYLKGGVVGLMIGIPIGLYLKIIFMVNPIVR